MFSSAIGEQYLGQKNRYRNDLIMLTVYASDGDGGGGGLLDGIKNFFVPDKDYFKGFFSDIRSAFDSKFSSVKKILDKIKAGFESLSGEPPKLQLKFPPKHILSGAKLNVLGGAESIITLAKAFLSAFLVILVSINCYRKIIALIGR